jgi:hypothetical protein
MEHIREYLLSVTAAALLCGILQSITGQKGSAGGILKLVCGIFLSFTVISPIAEIRLLDLNWSPSDVISEAQTAVEDGKDYAMRAMERHINEQAQAYILDKARALDAQIQVDIRVSEEDPPVPVGCTIQGEFSVYARKQLTTIIREDLGIPEEEQIWITSNSKSQS